MTTQDRLLELLAARETEGLSSEESRELETLLARHTDVDVDDLGIAAAAAHLEIQQAEGGLEAMPEALRDKILADADAHLVHAAAEDTEPASVVPGPFSLRYTGWYAAAAMLVLALWAPWSRSPLPPVPLPTPTLDGQRASLLEQAADVIQVAWARPEIETYAGVTGDVVWSPSRQTGFMRLKGLPTNTPGVEQYQLWIVDPTRDEHPIDGGVFDIPAGADEVIVPIDAKLAVDDARAFAITLEQPGGVVVSEGPLLVVAAVG